MNRKSKTIRRVIRNKYRIKWVNNKIRKMNNSNSNKMKMDQTYKEMRYNAT